MMIDQLRQAHLSSFRSKLKHFQINLILNPKDQSLSILVQNTHNLEKLSRVIDHQFIKEQQNSFQGVFEQPDDICFHLVDNFNDIIIEEDSLNIEYTYGIKKKSKNMRIRLFKEEVNHKQVISIEFEKMRYEFSLLLEQKDIKTQQLEQRVKQTTKMQEKQSQRIEQLEAKVQNPQIKTKETQRLQNLIDNLSREVEGLKTNQKSCTEQIKKIEGLAGKQQSSQKESSVNIKALQESLKNFENENRKLSQQLAKQKAKNADLLDKSSKEDVKYRELVKRTDKVIDELRQTLKGQENTNKQVMQQLQNLRLQSQSKFLKEQSPVPKKKKKKTKGKQSRGWVGHHHGNENRKHFKLRTTNSYSAKITKTNEGWARFANKFEVPAGQITKYFVKLTKVTNSNLIAGFCTQQGLKQICFPQLATYVCYNNGFLFQNGSSKQINVPVVQGQTLECIADLVNFKLKWAKKGITIAQTPISAEMRTKPLYLLLKLNQQGDEIDLYI